MKPAKSFILAAAAALALAGCQSGSGKLASSSPADLNGTAWAPVYVKGQENIAVPPADGSGFGKVFISFKESEKGMRVHGMSGNNLFNGGLNFESEGEVEFTPMAVTMRMGPYPEYESRFLKAIDSTDIIVRDGDTLMFYDEEDGGGELLMKFSRTEMPEGR